MHDDILNYAKRLKLSWIPQHYKEIKAQSQQGFLLKLVETEVTQREETKSIIKTIYLTYGERRIVPIGRYPTSIWNY